MVIVYPVTLLKSFVGSNRFLVKPLCFLYLRSSHLETDNFTSSFSIWIPFFYLTAMTMISNVMLVRGGENGHTFL